MNRLQMTIAHTTLAYTILGNDEIEVVIEMGLSATMGEWWHVANEIAKEHTVLLYERAGIGGSCASTLSRTPQNIALELKQLLDLLPHREQLILIGHSQGGLYAVQFTRAYPSMVGKLILLDPLSANDDCFKARLTPAEYKLSGVDKGSNVRTQQRLLRFHMGWLIQKLMKSAPPFYYYPDYSKECQDDILKQLVNPDLYATVLNEYQLAHQDDAIHSLRSKNGFPDVELVLITHSSEKEIAEIRDFGHTTEETASKIENVWQEIMQDYFSFSTNSRLLRAKNSCHFIHLTDMPLLLEQIQLPSNSRI